MEKTFTFLQSLEKPISKLVKVWHYGSLWLHKAAVPEKLQCATRWQSARLRQHCLLKWMTSYTRVEGVCIMYTSCIISTKGVWLLTFWPLKRHRKHKQWLCFSSGVLVSDAVTASQWDLAISPFVCPACAWPDSSICPQQMKPLLAVKAHRPATLQIK